MMGERSSVLVTGGAGYIGSHVVLALLDAGFAVYVIDNLATGERALVDQRAKFFEGAIENDSLLATILGMHDIRTIVHCAGSSPTPFGVTNPLDLYRNNTSASRSLIETALKCGLERFILMSSARIYGNPVDVPIREDVEPRPIDAFGMSILMTERILADAAQAAGFDFAILRYLNAAGADPMGRAGPPAKQQSSLIALVVEAALGRRTRVHTHAAEYPTPDGTPIADYIHVSDLASIVPLTLAWLRANPGQEAIWNCSYGKGFSTSEILDATERITLVRSGRQTIPFDPSIAPVVVTDNRAITAALGWQAQHDRIDAMVRHALNWEMKRPARPAFNFAPRPAGGRVAPPAKRTSDPTLEISAPVTIA